MSQNEFVLENANMDPKGRCINGDESLESLFDSLPELRSAQGSTVRKPETQNSTTNGMKIGSHSPFQGTAIGSAPILIIQEGWNLDSADDPLVSNLPNAGNTFFSKPATLEVHQSLGHPRLAQHSKRSEPSLAGDGIHSFSSDPRAHVVTQDEISVNPCTRNPCTQIIDDIGASTSPPCREKNEQATHYVESSPLRDSVGTHKSAPHQSKTHFRDNLKDQQRLRVDILSLDVVESPLQKDGRHTIICGRLPDNHPYAIAARGLGRYLISKRYSGVQECDSKQERRQNFLKDWKAFHEELLGFIPKLPVIGGGELDIYSLVHEVLLLGGVLNVVKKRAFRVVAQQLELPKSCTSAASVLKNAYEKLLFYYEEKLVHDRMPQDVTQKLDMKRMALEEKQKERRAAERLARMMASKKRNSGAYDMLLDVGDCTDLADNDCLDRDDPRLKRIMLAVSDRPRITLSYLDLIVSNDIEELFVPELEDVSDDDGSFRIVLHDVIQMDDHEQVESGADVVLLAMAECMKLSSLGIDPSFERPKDLGLAKALCVLPFCSPNMKRALGMLISAVIKASKVPSLLQLADRNSTHGLIDGMFYLLHRYIRNESSDDDEYEACEVDVLNAAYCALSVIQILLDEEENRSKVVTNVGFRHAVGRFLGCEDSNRSFVLVTLDIVAKCCTLMLDLFGERDMDFFVGSLVKRLEMATGLDPEAPLGSEIEKGLEVPPDYEVSSKVLPILVTLARKMGIKTRNCGRLIEVCVRMLHCQERIADNTSLALMAHIIAERFPNMISRNRDLVRGVLNLIRDSTCVDIASETLIIINRTLPVRELVLESGLFSGWKHCEADRDAPLTHLAERLGDEVAGGDVPHGLSDMVGASLTGKNGMHCAEEGATVPESTNHEDHEGDEESSDEEQSSMDTCMQEGPTALVQIES